MLKKKNLYTPIIALKIELNILIQLLINRLQVFVDALIGAEQTSVTVALPFTACEERAIVQINLRLVYKIREESADNNEATLNNFFGSCIENQQIPASVSYLDCYPW